MKNIIKKMKQNKGITLIALIITIIILLILAGVAIAQLTDSGLFGKTKLAKEKHQNAQSQEDDILRQYQNLINGGEISSYRDLDIQQLKNQIKQELKNEMTANDGNPVGTIIAYSVSTAPTGYLACNGQEVSRTTYATLFSIIGTTYGAGDGSTTFKLPDLRGEFLRGTGNNGANVGTHQTAGLPNITGYQNTYVDVGRGAGSGALYAYDDGADFNGSSTGSGTKYCRLMFDASKSNAIYGAAEEVRPTNTSVLYCIKF